MALHNVSNISVESTSLMGNVSAPSVTRLNNKSDRRWLRRCWTLHFALSIVAIGIGIFHNRNPVKKYLKINPSVVVSDVPCTSAYLNVLASSSTEPDATICCTANDSNSNHATKDNESCTSFFNYSKVLLRKARSLSKLQAEICTTKSKKLMFAGRLTKFPDAWLLPLFPLLFRVICYFVANVIKYISKGVGSLQFDANSTKSMVHMVRRFCFYFILMNVRGWVLYMLLNKIEDQFVSDLSSTGEKCWYTIEGWFPHSSEQELCAGRPFDFSDHIVLYYAQILPIALFETLHSIIENPKWYAVRTREQSMRQTQIVTTMRVHHSLRWFIPMVVFGAHVYLQMITTFGAYKTSIYFHTPFEILVGYIVSMTIAAPLCYLQCSDKNDPLLLYIRSVLLEN